MANDYKSQGTAALKEIEKGINETKDAQKKENQTLRDENVAAYTESTNEQIDQTSDAYLDVVRSVGIQKELDLRNIRETRANMGLSRSGLSATEQTAAILSAGNKVGAAQRSRQEAIDALNKSLREFTAQEDTKLRTANLAADNTARSKLATATQEINEKVMELESDDYQAWLDYNKSMAKITANNKTARKKDLKTLFDAELIDRETFSYALENDDVSVTEVLAFGKNRNKIKELRESGAIDEKVEKYALENNIPAERAEVIYNYGLRALKIMDSNGRHNAAEYIMSQAKLSEYDKKFIADRIGLTDDEVKKAGESSQQAPATDTQTQTNAKSLHPNVQNKFEHK